MCLKGGRTRGRGGKRVEGEKGEGEELWRQRREGGRMVYRKATKTVKAHQTTYGNTKHENIKVRKKPIPIKAPRLCHRIGLGLGVMDGENPSRAPGGVTRLLRAWQW